MDDEPFKSSESYIAIYLANENVEPKKGEDVLLHFADRHQKHEGSPASKKLHQSKGRGTKDKPDDNSLVERNPGPLLNETLHLSCGRGGDKLSTDDMRIEENPGPSAKPQDEEIKKVGRPKNLKMHSCPFCDYTPGDGPRRSSSLMSHINTRHRQELNSSIDISEFGFAVCKTCLEAHPNSGIGISSHNKKCGKFRTRAQIENERKVRLLTEPSDSTEGIDTILQKDKLPDAEKEKIDGDFFQTKYPTRKVLARNEWQSWGEHVYDTCLQGYKASPLEERYEKQIKFTEIVRESLTITKTKSGEQLPNSNWEKKCETLISLGAMSKASNLVLSPNTTVASPTKEVIEELKRLHPVEDQSKLPAKPASPIIVVSEKKFRTALFYKLKRGSAAGLDGWTRELLIAAISFSPNVSELVQLLEDIVNGNITEEMRMRLTSCQLIALTKEGHSKEKPKIRPIAPESCLFRLACHIGIASLSRKLSSFFNSRQVGVGGNVEKVAVKLREQCEKSDAMAVFDIANAFNTVKRSVILKKVYDTPSLAPLWALIAMSIGSPSDLIIYEDFEKLAVISSQSGVRQGSVFGPFLFAFALQDTLAQIDSKHGTTTVAYLDDTNVLGKVDALTNAKEELELLLKEIGLLLNLEKTILLHKPNISNQGWKNAKTSTVKVLGVAMSSSFSLEETAEFVNKQLKCMDDYFKNLSASSLKLKSKFILLKYCCIPKANFIMRTHGWNCVEQIALRFDEQTLSLMASIVGKDISSNTFASSIIHIPQSMGGF